MCGRFVVIESISDATERLNIDIEQNSDISLDFEPNYNFSIGQYIPVITNKNPKKFILSRFGLIPFWAKQRMALFNARAEGDNNKADDPDYKGAKGIILKPAFRKPIRTQRCLVFADAYIEGTSAKGLDEAFLIHPVGEKSFTFAAIWDEWTDCQTNETIHSFSIITTTANELVKKIPHHRMPVILPKSLERKWLDSDAPLTDITAILKPYPSEKMNAYPISNMIKNPKNNIPELLKPIGESVQSIQEFKLEKSLKLHGMGRYKIK